MDSRLYLPKLNEPPGTVLDYLVMRFPHIDVQLWRERMDQGRIRFEDGTVLQRDTPYRHGRTVIYARAVANEPSPKVSEIIIFQDDKIVVADKPHDMVVTPAGNYVERSLLVRLRQRTGLPDLTPMHRLDYETAGIVLFAVDRESRDRYHRLFAKKLVEREYRAVARLEEPVSQRIWHVANRMERGEPWFRQRISLEGGEVNAVTHIELQGCRNNLGVFVLRPETGKKHQLRVHMASIGFPIIGDRLYPEIRNSQIEVPLQLLAYRLAFVDPFSGERRSFESLVRFPTVGAVYDRPQF